MSFLNAHRPPPHPLMLIAFHTFGPAACKSESFGDVRNPRTGRRGASFPVLWPTFAGENKHAVWGSRMEWDGRRGAIVSEACGGPGVGRFERDGDRGGAGESWRIWGRFFSPMRRKKRVLISNRSSELQ